MDVAATFADSDTTPSHIEHCRAVVLRVGLPMALSGRESTRDGRDPKGEFQGVPTALSLHHLLAPSPLDKGKIERRFGSLQGRVVTLLGQERVQSFHHVPIVLQAEIDHLNRTVCQTAGMSPNGLCDQALQDGKTVMQPVLTTALFDEHLVFHYRHRRRTGSQVDFKGRWWVIAPTHPKAVGIIHHPGRQFRVITGAPCRPEAGGVMSLQGIPSHPVHLCSRNEAPFELSPTPLRFLLADSAVAMEPFHSGCIRANVQDNGHDCHRKGTLHVSGTTHSLTSKS